MRGVRNYLVVFIIVILVMFFFSCREEEKGPEIRSIRIYGKVTDTFSGKILSGVQVVVKDSNGNEYEVRSDEEGRYEVRLSYEYEEGEPGKDGAYIKIYYNFDHGKEDYLPSVLTKNGGESKDSVSTMFKVERDTEINMDLVKKDDLFLKEFIQEIMEEAGCDEKEGIKGIMKAMRGGYNGARNCVWVTQPERWIIYDPLGKLKEFDDPKDNYIFRNIMEGFRAIEEYTDGFIKAPTKDKVEIIYDDGRTPDGALSFNITDGEAFEGEEINSNSEIIRSAAGAGWDGDIIQELTSSVQGGDNDGYVGVFNEGVIKQIDKVWGKFSYKKREPGSAVAYREDLYDFPFETRDYEEILRLKR